MNNKQSLLSLHEQAILQDALYFMKMAELKDVCLMLSLPSQGKKLELITRIMTFIQHNTITTQKVIPSRSKARSHPIQSLHPQALMLHGGYKNDAKTRSFLKNLIGPHFHFTAFGIDWLNDRWHEGNPPTYQEFVDYWIAETKQRASAKPEPKDEWRYIRFVQQMQLEVPNMTKDEVMTAWKELQADQARIARKLIKIVVSKRN